MTWGLDNALGPPYVLKKFCLFTLLTFKSTFEKNKRFQSCTMVSLWKEERKEGRRSRCIKRRGGGGRERKGSQGREESSFSSNSNFVWEIQAIGHTSLFCFLF